MAMQLDIIKTQTTWNDAAASLNNNFSKINRAVRDGIPVVDTPVDEEMSDTSTNAVQNKVIKKYVDDAEAEAKDYTDKKIAQIGGGGGGTTNNNTTNTTTNNITVNTTSPTIDLDSLNKKLGGSYL